MRLEQASRALIRGTKDLGDALQEIASGILADIGKQLLSFGVKSAFSSLLAGSFADGWTSTSWQGQPSLGSKALSSLSLTLQARSTAMSRRSRR